MQRKKGAKAGETKVQGPGKTGLKAPPTRGKSTGIMAMLLATLLGMVALQLYNWLSGERAKPLGGWLVNSEWESEWGNIPCDVVDYRGRSFSSEDFQKVALEADRPVIWRQELPSAALKALGREELLAKCGEMEVNLAKLRELAHGGRTSSPTTAKLKDYLQMLREPRPEPLTLEELEEEFYLFDSTDGSFLRRCQELGIQPDPPIAAQSSKNSKTFQHFQGPDEPDEASQTALPTPSALAAHGQIWWSGHGSDLRITIGRAGSGIALHQHSATYNWLVYGSRRWTLFPPNSTVNAMGWNPFASHLSWLTAKPRRWGFGDVMECVQQPGDVLFIPDGWHHGVLNLAETVTFARNGVGAARGTLWEAFLEGQRLVMAAGFRNPDPNMLKEAESIGKIALQQAEGGHCPQCWVHLAVVYSLQKRPQDEIHASRQAVLQNPEDPIAWKNLAFVLAEQEMFDEAMNAVRNSQRLIKAPGRGVPLSYPLKLIAAAREGAERQALLEEAAKWQ